MSAFTMEKLKEAMALLDTIPPPPVFASSEDFPMDSFWQFERDGREYVLGHPTLWAKVPAQRSDAPLGLAAIRIENVDDPSRRELKAKIRFWVATASHRPGEPPKWPRSAVVEPSLKSRVSAARTNPDFKTDFKTASEAGEKSL